MFSRISIKRPVATVMVLIITIMAGLVACFSLKMDLMPNVDMPIAVVSTTYVGAGPEEVETLITKPVESALSTVTNVDSIQSVSSANSSMVIVTFINGTDLDMASLDMREKVDMIKDYLPDGAEEPMVLKIDINSLSGISVGIDSDKLSLKELNTLVEEEIVSRFEKIEGVASVSITGGITEEIQVVVNPEKMAGYGISESTIASMLAAENLNTPAGSLKQGSTKLTVKSEGEFESIEEIAEMPLMTNYGAIIHLRDVAEVKLVDKEMESYALIDGNPGVMLYIQKQSDANIVDVSEELVKEIEKVSRDYGQINIQLLTDTADYIKFAVGNMVTTAFQAAFLAIFVVFAFLRSGRMSFIIGVSIPTSIIATFALMWSQDMTMNMISMGGLTIGIGMLVDNSIVVLENIYQKMKLGMEPKEAAAQGANEVAMAVAASTLTTMGVFVPLMFVNGVAGQMMKDLSLTLCFSLFA
ncbi:MAG: efflux RND transporter permease subunit, partial [Firmicutes bacterium]|nr:efflux RND transporter permease subunit [Bacillota bacterium]